MKRIRQSSGARGFTLLEVILFIVIVSVGLAGVLTVFSTGVRSSADPMIRKQAILIAEATMNEIMQKSFQNDPADPANTSATLGCTPNTAPITCAANSWANRPNYNDVDDYNGFNQTGILQIDGSTAVNGLANYTLQINVAGAALSGIAAANAKRIVVTVTNGGTESVNLTGYRTNYQ
jgi:MSHA pilin protein MshD